jgi:hypothetical protein
MFLEDMPDAGGAAAPQTDAPQTEGTDSSAV